MLYTDKFSLNYYPGKYISQNDSTIFVMSNEHSGATGNNDFGARLRDLRMRVGMSQIELSQAVKDMTGGNKKGTQSHISNLENSDGAYLPSVPVLKSLAIILGTNTDYLLGLTDDDSPHGQLDDQVVVTVEDPTERAMLQDAIEMLTRTSSEDKEYIVSLIRRLAPKKPRIIGDE